MSTLTTSPARALQIGDVLGYSSTWATVTAAPIVTRNAYGAAEAIVTVTPIGPGEERDWPILADVILPVIRGGVS